MKRLTVVLTLVAAGAHLAHAQGMVIGKVKSPLRIMVDYSMADPTTAPTVAQSAAGGLCLNGSTYAFAQACANESGVTAPGPFSNTITMGATKKVTVTFTGSCPANALGKIVYWKRTSGTPTTPALCGVTTLESAFVAIGTATFDCTCSGSTANPGNQTGVKTVFSINQLGNNLAGRATFAGGNLNLITENGAQGDLSIITGTSVVLGGNGDVTGARTLGMSSSTVAAPSSGWKFDGDTNSIDLYKGGALAVQTRSNEWIPPDCATTDGPGTFGGFCKDAATGAVLFRDSGGVRILTGATR